MALIMQNATREAIIQASARIAQLREVVSKAKEDLKKAESALDALLRSDTSGAQAPAPPSIAPEITASVLRGPFVDLAQQWRNSESETSLNQRLVDYLDAQPARDFDSDELFTAFPSANQTSIRSALARLADSGKIQRSKRGRYQSSKAVQATEAV